MNKANLKSYAPKARLDFIKAVTERANVLGISAAGVVPAEVRGDVALIDGREWPAKVAGQRDELIARIKRHGFEQTMDEVAYTWFNRFAALRYMEIHDYLGHGWRVLSSRDGGLPEILRHASEVTLPGLNADRARDMQLAGNQDNELYKLLLVAQCNELSRVMPFLFERIDDETELLLPENLLRTDSIVAKLAEQVPEDDWQEIEVIGWLYQFYISEKKDQVIGKVVKSEDIPAATQLFTPNWIVQYLVQNSVGRLWLMANPTSTLASQWPYYIQPAEQRPEVQAQVDALIQTRIREDGETLNPETITVLDPACGSGHILVVAYDVLKAIYLERGYQARAIPRLILEKNLYGLDIDDRAAQLAAFALLMKARADDRRLFNEPPKLNVLSLQESKGLDYEEIATHLAPFGLRRESLRVLFDTFAQAKTFGSLIQIPAVLCGQLGSMTAGVQKGLQDGDLYAQQAAKDALALIWQALVLAMQFDAVVANPPYMGNKFFTPALKSYVASNFEFAKGDLYTCFMARGCDLAKEGGRVATITIPNWMFLSTFEELRGKLLNDSTIETFLHNGRGVFGSDFGSCAFSIVKGRYSNYKGRYKRLFDKQGSVASNEELESRFHTVRPFEAVAENFEKIPGSPIAYWASDAVVRSFQEGKYLGVVAETRKGMGTGDNARFVRYWHEVSSSRLHLKCASREEASSSGKRWFPYNDGGAYRKWYGNNEMVVNWESDGAEAKENATIKNDGGHWSRYLVSLDYFFRPGITWTAISSSRFSARQFERGYLFSSAGMCLFSDLDKRSVHLGLLNSNVASHLLTFLSPTVNYGAGEIGRLPVPAFIDSEATNKIVAQAVELAKEDWDSQETSWDFEGLRMVVAENTQNLLEKAWLKDRDHRNAIALRLKELEEANNRVFITAYNLQNDLEPSVPDDQIAVTRPEREHDCLRLISYAIGCVLGRYSLDEPGLIYARAGNAGFDANRYSGKLAVDDDGIVPNTGEHWFEDDVANRVREFLSAVWGTNTLVENLAWLAESIGKKGQETSDETIRRYLADRFFKDHLQTYKRRPIYWLFSSGKLGAFQALVYLHRYNEGTLARMRSEYVLKLIPKMASRLDTLDKDVAESTSAAARAKLQKQIELLRKKQIELLAFEEKLRHYADMRITLDLDDGVKTNYAKFGDLVAESKAITGGSDE